MLLCLVPLLVTVSTVTSIQHYPLHDTPASAASSSQIKFAIENKYDDTGPGAKKTEYAYNTYKTLDEALVAYLDDPDTKLPESEREKAIQKLLSKSQVFSKPGFYHNQDNFVPNFKKPRPSAHSYDAIGFNLLGGKLATKVYPTSDSVAVFTKLEKENMKQGDPYKFQKIQLIRGSPLNLSHFVRDPDLKSSFDNFESWPRYSFSYGVNDKSTGDVKQAGESRNGGHVRGFYTFIDADGKHRTVHYTADDVRGFTASVSKRP